MKFLERHSILPTSFPYQTDWKSILQKRQSCIPMPKPHDYVVLAVISTAHLRDNRICCLLYLPRGN